MSAHRQPNGRPVHPECEVFTGLTCTCDALWSEWDGTDADLASLIDTAYAADLRRLGGVTGDLVEDEAAKDTEDLTGFWKESSFLKTVDRD